MSSTQTVDPMSSINAGIENPMGTEGFEFVEFTGPKAEDLSKLFESLGFMPVAKHRNKNITLYQQNEINFILNNEAGSFAADFSKKHGPSACGMAFRVKNAKEAFARALSLGAKAYREELGSKALDIPAIYGIGDSLLYFVDHSHCQYHTEFDFNFDFGRDFGGDFGRNNSEDELDPQASKRKHKGVGLNFIDHLTHNVHTGRMDEWADYYQRLFNFREIRYFDIKGQHTGLVSRALTSPCNKIRIPLNESQDDQSQIAEYLREYQGEGIQHIALNTDNIYDTIEALHKIGVPFLDTPTTYYELIENRLPNHGENVSRMQENKILIDGGEEQGGGFLLQIFTNTVIGPIFFEIIQRKGNEGFGEGNFKALFESIELDQIRRGVIKA